MNQQLQLFPDTEFFQPKPLYNEFYGDWEPKVGDIVQCDATGAYNETNGRTQYCYCMRCIIISMDGRDIRVSPTQEWCDACGGNGVLYKTTDVWLIDSYFIAPNRQLKAKIAYRKNTKD